MNNKRKVIIIFSWLCVAACMITIFMLSAQPAVVSSESSDGWIEWIYNLFGIKLSSHLIRKAAHAIEYFGLCLTLNFAVTATALKYKPFLCFVLTVFYAVTDEVHQIFVDGRACQLKDMLIDSSGALLCIAALSIIYLCYKKYCNKRRKECQF